MLELSPEQRALVGTVVGSVQYSENTLRRQLEQRWNHFYGLYRSYQVWKSGMSQRQDRRDRDLGLSQAKREWGADFFIPYVFTAIETELPRVFAQPPVMNVMPRRRAWEENVAPVRAALLSQMEQASMELDWQTTAKSGLTYGLGIQKSFWRRSGPRNRPVIKASMNQGAPGTPIEYVSAGPEETVLWDDPDGQDVDVFDAFWDPMGDSPRTCTWMCHRVWRNTEYVLRMLGLDRQSVKAQADHAAASAAAQAAGGEAPQAPDGPRWNLVPGITVEDVKSAGSPQRYTQMQSDRARASGLPQTDFKGRQVHEVLEYHDGERVIVVLDRLWPVMVAANPNWKGVLPFHTYRPTEVMHRFEGIGEPEAIEDLQIEMNVLRGQRRDNATLKLMQSFAYDEGAIDPDDIRFGPGELIPVAGPPNELLYPLTVGDIPNSSFQEGNEISQDMQRVTGISDLAAGAPGTGATDTATGSQLMIAAANERIRNKTKRFGLEVIVPQADYWTTLNQTNWITQSDVRIPYIPKPGEPDRRWTWFNDDGVGPEDLAGEFEFHIVPDSMSPANVQQDRADFQMVASLLPALAQLFNMPKMAGWMLEKLGIEQPEQYLAMPNMVPPQALELIKQFLEQKGGNPQEIDSMIQQAVQAAEQGQGQVDSQAPPNQANGGPPAAGGEQQPAPAAPVPEPVQQGANGKGQDNRRKQ